MKRLRKIFSRVLLFVIILLIIRIFIFQVVRMDGFTMAGTLLPGDRILLNKLTTGSRFPTTLSLLPGINSAYLDQPRIPYFRLPGFRKFQRGDLVIFNDPVSYDKPLDRRELKASRLVGLPGDTVAYFDKQLYVNQDTILVPTESRFEYRVVTDGRTVPDDFLTEYDLQRPNKIEDIGIFDYSLSEEAVTAMEKQPGVKTVRPTRQFYGDPSTDYYPPSYYFKWNRDQFGALIVPKKGDVIRLDTRSVDLYRDIIEKYEGNEIETDYNGFLINGERSLNYTIKKNYYFIFDDNRDRPRDSRIIGFIPEDHLLGTAKRILYSRQKEYPFIKPWHFNRFLKRISD